MNIVTSKYKIFIFLFLTFSIFLYSCQPAKSPTEPENVAEPVQAENPSADAEFVIIDASAPVTWEFRGASLAGYWNDSYEQPNTYDLIDYMKESGVNTVAVIVSWYQDDMQANEIYAKFDKETPTDESLETLIDYIHAQGMAVMLKPHLEPLLNWEQNGSGWRGVIRPSEPEIWFQNYETFITHYVEIAQNQNVELFSIGTEMPSTTQGEKNQAHWIAMTEKIKQTYSGALLYSAHEYEVLGGHYETKGTEPFQFTPLPPSFWQPFNYAGTTVYYDLYDPNSLKDSNPEANTLIKGWYDNPSRNEEQRYLVEAITAWHETHGKPVIFSEIGYRSIDYAAYHPYNTSGANGKDLDANYNEDAQANAYESAFRVWGNLDWLAGAFWWQFSPLAASGRECGKDFVLNPAEEITYTPCGKAAGEVLHLWYDGAGEAPSAPPTYSPHLPDLLDLNTTTNKTIQRAWRTQSSGEINFSLDPDVQYGAQPQSLHVVSNIACANPRYGHLDYLFTTPQNFSDYNSLSFSVRAANKEDHGEVSIILVDMNGVEWQSTNWLAGEQWKEFRIALRPGADTLTNPWSHPVDFVVPTWFKFYDGHELPQTFDLDLSKIAGIRLKAATVDAECETNPHFEVWFGDLRLSEEKLAYEPLPVSLPIIDNFDFYENRTALIMSGNWESYASGVLAMDVVKNSVLGNQPALEIMTDLPCANERYAGVARRFLEPLDLSGYSALNLRVRGDGLNEPPYGGDFTVTLRDSANDQEEIWQNSRWISRAEGWIDITIQLQGTGQDNPWNRNDFAIPSWEKKFINDSVLDLSHIVAIEIQTGTSNAEDEAGNSICALHPQMWIWVDDILVQ